MFKRVVLLFLLSLFLINNSSANFACGEIYGNYSSAWMTVSINYKENPLLRTTCEVSPLNNKYCCDPRSINGVSWAIGKTLEARLLNDEGYFIDPTNLTITGEGFDLFGVRELKKAVVIEDQPIIELNEGNFYLKISSSEPFLLNNYSLYHEGLLLREGNLCNCNNQNISFDNLTSGNYEFFVSATNGQEIFYDSIKKTFLDFLNINREITCVRCKRIFVPVNSEVTMKILINSSHNLDGTIYEYFPSSWNYSGSEEIEIGEEYNLIKWSINGSLIEKNYFLQSPHNFIKKYFFVTSFEDYLDSPDEVVVYKFNPIFRYFLFSPKGIEENSESVSSVSNLKNGVGKPIILYSDDKFVSEIALFYNSEQINSKLYFEPIKEFPQNGFYSFSIKSNVERSKIDKAYIKFRIGKDFLISKNILSKDVTLYLIDSGYNEEQEIVKFFEDEDFYYFEATSKGVGQYFIGERNELK